MAVVAFPVPAGADEPAALLARAGAGGAGTVVALRGQWDRFTRPTLADVLAGVVADGGAGDVVIDLAEAEFIDADTLFTLAAARRLFGRDGRTLSVRSPSRLVTRMLALLGLADLVEAEARSSP